MSDGESVQRSCPTPFLTKTYQLVDDPETDDLISWNEDGTTFIIWRTPEFARDLLPRFFKHNNFSSFGFRKVVPDQWEFANECFRRGEKGLLRDIQRRKITPVSTQIVTVAVPATAKSTSSAENSGDEQVLSSNSSPAGTTTATATLLRTCSMTTADILEENDRLRKENAELTQELTRLRSLCGNVRDLMSNYTPNVQAEEISKLAKEQGIVSLQENPIVGVVNGEGSGGGGGGIKEEGGTSPRLFGVSIGLKRMRSIKEEEGSKFEPSDQSSLPWLDKL